MQQSAPRSLITRDPLVNPNALDKDVGATKHERCIGGDSEWIGAVRCGWILRTTILPSNPSTQEGAEFLTAETGFIGVLLPVSAQFPIHTTCKRKALITCRIP